MLQGPDNHSYHQSNNSVVWQSRVVTEGKRESAKPVAADNEAVPVALEAKLPPRYVPGWQPPSFNLLPSPVPAWQSPDLDGSVESQLPPWDKNFDERPRTLENSNADDPGTLISEPENLITESEDLYRDELDRIKPADLNDPDLDIPGLNNRENQPDRRLRTGPPSRRENPGWWINEIQRQQLKGREALATNIDEIIFLALQNSPQIQILNTRPMIQETLVGEQDAQFDWTQFVETTWNDTNEPIGSTLTTGGLGRFVQREWTLDAGVRRQLRNGGSFNITQRYGTLDSNSTFLNPPNQGNSRLLLDYRQPLLRNRGRLVTMSQVALASLDFNAVSNESRAGLQDFLVNVVRSYWQVYFRRAALVINRRGLERAEELMRQLRLRDGIDVRNDQLLRAEAAVASRRSNVIRAEFELVNAQDRMINVTVGPKYLAQAPEHVEFMPVALDLPLGIQFDPTYVAQAAVHNRPEVHQSIANLRSAAIRNQVSENQILPRLDAVLTTSTRGLRGNKNVGGAFVDQFSQGDPSYSAGFQFELPIGNRAAKYRLDRARLEMSLAERDFETTVGDILVDARISSREITRLNEENQNNWSALLKANEELFLIHERQRLQLDDGKVGSLYIEDLLASQARLTAAELRLAQSQIDQAIALIDLKRSAGVLIHGNANEIRPLSFEADFSIYAETEFAQSQFGFPDDTSVQAQLPFESNQPIQPVVNLQTSGSDQPIEEVVTIAVESQPVGPGVKQIPGWQPSNASPVQPHSKLPEERFDFFPIGRVIVKLLPKCP